MSLQSEQGDTPNARIHRYEHTNHSHLPAGPKSSDLGGDALGIQRTPRRPECSTGTSLNPDGRTTNGSIVRHVMLINCEPGLLADKRGHMLTFGNTVGGRGHNGAHGAAY